MIDTEKIKSDLAGIALTVAGGLWAHHILGDSPVDKTSLGFAGGVGLLGLGLFVPRSLKLAVDSVSGIAAVIRGKGAPASAPAITDATGTSTGTSTTETAPPTPDRRTVVGAVKRAAMGTYQQRAVPRPDTPPGGKG